MKKSDKSYLIIVIAFCFIWAGLIIGISFLEAWLKFQAPNVTISIGLGIGRLVFGALNRIECFLGVLIFFLILWIKVPFLSATNRPFFMVILILLIQTFWLLPALDTFALAIINGSVATSGNLHLYYIILEALKLMALLNFGLNQLMSKYFLQSKC